MSRRLLVVALGASIVLVVIPPRPGTGQTQPGILVERVRARIPPEVNVGDRVLTIVRVDPARYSLHFLLEMRDGPRRPLPAWVRDFDLAGGINLGMFLPNGRPVGYAKQDGHVCSSRRPPRYNAWFGFGPLAPASAPLAAGGTGCPQGFDGLNAQYGSLLQGARLLVDCAGRAQTTWRTNRYSAAALGLDRDGRLVMVHVRTPYRMHILAAMLAEPSLGIRGLVYMEGGPEASLVVGAEDVRVSEMGSYEDGFNPNDDNRVFWDLPNVVAFRPRP